MIAYPGPERRRPHFAGPDDLAAEVRRIADAGARVRTTGTWTAGQILWHVGRLMEFSFDGFPFRLPWPQRVAARLVRLVSWRLLLWLAFRPGHEIPAAAAALRPDPAVTLADAAAYLLGQLERLRRGERMTQPSPYEGPITHEHWVEAHLRHAELHLGFIQVSPADP